MTNSENKVLIASDEDAFERVITSFRAVMARTGKALASDITALARRLCAVTHSAIYLYMAKRRPKWYHYCKHAKRRRIRKKYCDKLLREMIALIEKGVI